MHMLKKASVILLAMTLSLPIFALTLDQAMSTLSQAKSSGLVGEQADGYLGVVKNEGEAAEIAKLINQARKQEYQKVATQSNVAITEVEKIAGSKAQDKTPSGQYIKLNGKWQQK